MNVQTLLAMAALHQRNGQSDLACQLMGQAATLDGFDSYVSEIIRRPMNSALVGGAPRGENTIAPSLHGSQDSLGLAVAIASNIYTHNSYLDDDEVLEFSPSTEALAYASGNDSDFIDDDELVSVSTDEPKASFGRIEIKF